jgi:transcriptional regulator with XRE-family HTH domain
MMAQRKLLNRLAEHIAYIERRTGRKISNRQIVRDTGLSRATVDGYINNDRQQYDSQNVLKICEYLGIDPVTEFWVIEEVDAQGDEPGQNETPLGERELAA